MSPDRERAERIHAALAAESLDGLVCALPSHVLLLTGYWPVVGTSVAVARRDGRVALVAPEDERELAERGGAAESRFFTPGALDELQTASAAIRKPLGELLAPLQFAGASVGYECGETFEPGSYVAMHLYAAEMKHLLRSLLPHGQIRPAGPVLERLTSVLTTTELSRVRSACRMAREAYTLAARRLAPGLTESAAAEGFRAAYFASWPEDIERVGAHFACMSGPNAGRAYGAFARSRRRTLQAGELVLVHCNSQADGYWTDITRTYCLGAPNERQQAMYDAVFAARAAALATIGPGVRGADVDSAVRSVLRARGLESRFKHPTGHGCGFAAINHLAPPRLHPRSADVLEPGMVFNVEPAVYFENEGGLRHCDMVAVTARGAELLTHFHSAPSDLILAPAPAG